MSIPSSTLQNQYSNKVFDAVITAVANFHRMLISGRSHETPAIALRPWRCGISNVKVDIPIKYYNQTSTLRLATKHPEIISEDMQENLGKELGNLFRFAIILQSFSDDWEIPPRMAHGESVPILRIFEQSNPFCKQPVICATLCLFLLFQIHSVLKFTTVTWERMNISHDGIEECVCY